MIIDASALLPLLVDDGPTGARVRAEIELQQISAPSLIDLEVIAAVRRHLNAGKISESRAGQAVADLESLDIERLPHEPLLERVWQLRDNLTPYDASYVAAAELLDDPLLTADARLANASGPLCEFILLED